MTLDGHHMAPEILWNDPTQRRFESVFECDHDSSFIYASFGDFFKSETGTTETRGSSWVPG